MSDTEASNDKPVPTAAAQPDHPVSEPVQAPAAPSQPDKPAAPNSEPGKEMNAPPPNATIPVTAPVDPVPADPNAPIRSDGTAPPVQTVVPAASEDAVPGSASKPIAAIPAGAEPVIVVTDPVPLAAMNTPAATSEIHVVAAPAATTTVPSAEVNALVPGSSTGDTPPARIAQLAPHYNHTDATAGDTTQSQVPTPSAPIPALPRDVASAAFMNAHASPAFMTPETASAHFRRMIAEMSAFVQAIQPGMAVTGNEAKVKALFDQMVADRRAELGGTDTSEQPTGIAQPVANPNATAVVSRPAASAPSSSDDSSGETGSSETADDAESDKGPSPDVKAAAQDTVDLHAVYDRITREEGFKIDDEDEAHINTILDRALNRLA